MHSALLTIEVKADRLVEMADVLHQANMAAIMRVAVGLALP